MTKFKGIFIILIIVAVVVAVGLLLLMMMGGTVANKSSCWNVTSWLKANLLRHSVNSTINQQKQMRPEETKGKTTR